MVLVLPDSKADAQQIRCGICLRAALNEINDQPAADSSRLGDQHSYQRKGERPARRRTAVEPALVSDDDGRKQQCLDRRDDPAWAQAEPCQGAAVPSPEPA